MFAKLTPALDSISASIRHLEDTKLDDETREDIQAIAIGLGVLRDRIQTAVAGDDGTVSDLAHDLRSPLNSIVGYPGMLLDFPDMLTLVQVEALADIEQQGKFLLRQINNWIKYARIRTQRLEMVPPEAVSVIELLSWDEGPKFELDLAPDLPPAHGSVNAMADGLHEIAHNATVYSNGHPVHIKAESDQDHLVIRIQDKGIGIRADDVERIFEPFWQADSTSPGLGLGLFIAQHMISTQSGQLSIESQPGMGTTFNVTLPAGRQS